MKKFSEQVGWLY